MVDNEDVFVNRVVCHLRYCRITFNSDRIVVKFRGKDFNIIYEAEEFRAGKGFVVSTADEGTDYLFFLQWLSIYIGEDVSSPNMSVDTRFNWERGDFELDQSKLNDYYDLISKFEKRRIPIWRRELFNSSLMYCMMGVGSGYRYMPMSMGFFALSLECIGNFSYGKRDKHWTLGDRKFLSLLSKALEGDKKDMSKKANARAFEKRMHADIDLLSEFRNAFYGHSLLHLQRDKSRLLEAFKQWLIRCGFAKNHIKVVLAAKDVKRSITNSIPALYKLGLRINRMFIFLALGTREIPYATHDFKYLGDLRNDEVSEYAGVRMTSRFEHSDSEENISLKIDMELKKT